MLTIINQNLTMMATIAFNDFVNPWALAAMHWKYYLVYCGWLAVELVFVFFFIVETKGKGSFTCASPNSELDFS